MRQSRAVVMLGVTVGAGLWSCAAGQTIDPRGIYFNAFTGPFSGTEWFQTIPIAGTDRYRVADIFGGGFNATITPAGVVTLDGGVGGGSFLSADAYTIRPNLSGSVFTFANVRVPGTTPDFPLELSSPVVGNGLLGGVYRTLTTSIDPRSGASLGGGFEDNTIAVSGATFRITDPGGLFFQGVFESPTLAAFRVVAPTPSDARFRSFSGSSINFTQNMLGSVRVTSVNTFEAVFLLQSRTPLGSQTQAVFTMSSTRINPLPMGDLNGDRAVNLTDRGLLIGQLGLTGVDDAFNIAADLDGDLDADATDLAALDALICVPDFTGEGRLDVFDVLAFFAAFGGGIDVRADLTGDGAIDVFDIFRYFELFGAGC